MLYWQYERISYSQVYRHGKEAAAPIHSKEWEYGTKEKGQKYEISYRCPKYEKLFSERFDSYEAAKLRIAQIEYERSLGVFEPPQQTILAPKRITM